MTTDVHEQAPDDVWALFKKYRKSSAQRVDGDFDVVDFARGFTIDQENHFTCTQWSDEEKLAYAMRDFLHSHEPTLSGSNGSCFGGNDSPTSSSAYTHTKIPGLTIIPNLLPHDVQKELLARIFYRDLSISQHKTNLHLHYHVRYPSNQTSFFSLDPASKESFVPIDGSLHRPLTIERVLTKKLRWMTLGGQYDWTSKVYPDEQPPPFPKDMQTLLANLFPDTTAEAAIVNLYSPGDTLSLHRDVAETSKKGLISISIGCDALFVLGMDSTEEDRDGACRKVVLRLHSGDVVYMADEARFAWHGVPMIVPDTCPPELQNWPAGHWADGESHGNAHVRWRSWMTTKRININVRQMD